MPGKGTLWLAGHFDRRRAAAAAAVVAPSAVVAGLPRAAGALGAGAVRFLRGRFDGGAASSEGECGRRT